MIAKGTYPAKVTDRQFGYADTGTEQIALTFRLGGESDFAGQSITGFFFFTDKTWERTMETLRYCGWQGDDLADLGPLDNDVDVVIDHEADQKGVLRAKVRWVNRSGGGRVELKKPMDATQLRQFSAQMKSRAQQVRAAPGARSQPRSNGGSQGHGGPVSDEPPPMTDDDLPF